MQLYVPELIAGIGQTYSVYQLMLPASRAVHCMPVCAWVEGILEFDVEVNE